MGYNDKSRHVKAERIVRTTERGVGKPNVTERDREKREQGRKKRSWNEREKWSLTNR